MKIRFYRGPYDGKVKEVAGNYVAYQVAINNSVNIFAAGNSLAQTPPMDIHTYVRTRHTHPDGSVFFEWDKPKGTKWSKGKKKKRKKTSLNWSYQQGNVNTTTLNLISGANIIGGRLVTQVTD